jgi:hypothetical protein
MLNQKKRIIKENAKFSILLAMLFALTISCQPDLSQRGRIRPYGVSATSLDQMNSKDRPEGAIPYEKPDRTNDMMKSKSVVDEKLLRRGEKSYLVHCQVCHGLAGYGDGMAVQRGFSAPPSFHSELLRQLSPQTIYEIETNGFGRMFKMKNRIPSDDRWAIANYIKVLQLSQHFPLNQLNPEDKIQLNRSEK